MMRLSITAMLYFTTYILKAGVKFIDKFDGRLRTYFPADSRKIVAYMGEPHVTRQVFPVAF